MVMYAPGGVASLIMMNLRVAKFGKLRTLWVSYLALAGTALVAILGLAALVEMIYHIQLNSALGPVVPFLWAHLNTQGVDAWAGAVFVVITGLALFEVARRSYKHQWDGIQEEIERDIKRREAL
jgi:branched-chain amino acid transport system permease protein